MKDPKKQELTIDMYLKYYGRQIINGMTVIFIGTILFTGVATILSLAGVNQYLTISTATAVTAPLTFQNTFASLIHFRWDRSMKRRKPHYVLGPIVSTFGFVSLTIAIILLMNHVSLTRQHYTSAISNKGGHVTASSTLIPIPSPTVDWSSWINENKQWSVNQGVLISDGSAPCCNAHVIGIVASPAQDPTGDNYTVTATIENLGLNDESKEGQRYFGIFVRGAITDGHHGYVAGLNETGKTTFGTFYDVLSPGKSGFQQKNSIYASPLGKHVYQVTVSSSTIKFTMDEKVVWTVTDNTYPSGKMVGILDSGYKLQVSSFDIKQN